MTSTTPNISQTHSHTAVGTEGKPWAREDGTRVPNELIPKSSTRSTSAALATAARVHARARVDPHDRRAGGHLRGGGGSGATGPEGPADGVAGTVHLARTRLFALGIRPASVMAPRHRPDTLADLSLDAAPNAKLGTWSCDLAPIVWTGEQDWLA